MKFKAFKKSFDFIFNEIPQRWCIIPEKEPEIFLHGILMYLILIKYRTLLCKSESSLIYNLNGNLVKFLIVEF